MAEQDLLRKRAVITGAARGMGYAIAERFLSLGAQVTLWDINQDRLSNAHEKLASYHPEKRADIASAQVDISDFENVHHAAAAAAKQFGGIELLINAAGIAGATAPVTSYPNDIWNDVLAVNLTGTFHTCKAIIPYMQQAQFGRIVNIASIAGKEGNPNASAYSTSKAGVIGLTKSLGKELAETQITANVICPAVIDTEMLADITEEHIQYMLSKIPMGRMGSVDEIANLVEFLCSEGCSYSTGAVYDLSGGRATY